jgi:hypothetical protein
MRMGTVAIGAVTAALVLAGCAGSGGEEAGGGDTGGGAVGESAGALDAIGTPRRAAGGASAGGAGASTTLPEVGDAVIKTARVELEVDRGEVRGAADRAAAVAERWGGLVVSLSVEGERATSAAVVVRVPADRFGRAVTDLRDIGRPVGESIDTEDVSRELVDLDARLRNLVAQEGVLLGLMNEATTVAATIQVQRVLGDTQSQIERLRGQIRYLSDRVAMATIAVDVRASGAEPAAAPGPIRKAFGDAADAALTVVAAVIVAVGAALPVVALAALAAVTWAFARRRLRGQTAS